LTNYRFYHKIVEIFEHKPNIIKEYIKLKKKIEEEVLTI